MLWHEIPEPLASWLMPLARLVEAGGPVLIVIGLVAALLFTLLLERTWYLQVTYRQARQALFERWIARHEHASWSARTQREVWTRELIAKLRAPLPWLKLLVALCPLLGLLGTVTGMILVFDGLVSSTSVQARSMADGVAQATLPTLTGMAVAMVGLLAVGRLEQRIRREDQKLHDRLARALERSNA